MYGLNKTAVHSISFDPNDAHYVLQLCGHSQLELLAASSTNCSVKLYDRPKLNFVRDLPGHTARINDVSCSETHGLFLSAGDDGKVFAWDPRAEAAAHSLQLHGEAFSVTMGGAGEGLMAVATEQQVRVWDVRSMGSVLGVLEPHSDDVAQVRFHPSQRHMLLSGGVDGLVCVHDTSLGMDEDEATIAVLNVEQPITALGFHGDNGERLHCTTTVEGFAIFDMTTFDPVASVLDSRPGLSGAFETQVDYLISAHWCHGKLYLAAGNQEGEVVVGELDPSCAADPRLVAKLPGGHSEPVRTLYWHPQLEYLVTGGEDSKLCWWGDAASAAVQPAPAEASPSLKMGKEKENRAFAPY